MRPLHLGTICLVLTPVIAGAGCKRQRQAYLDTQGIGSAVSLAMSARAQSHGTVSGTVHSVGGVAGTWDMTLADCQSGELDGFYGVDFYVAGSDEMRLRYVHDEAAGDVVKIPIPPKMTDRLVLRNDKTMCTLLDGKLEKTNVSTWTPKGNIRRLDGHVKFDCTTTEGKGHVTGDITFSQCALAAQSK
jgi:hypothetical protein